MDKSSTSSPAVTSEDRRKLCTVCERIDRIASGFSYGVWACNACKQIFRNAEKAKRPVSDCKLGSKDCPRDTDCRFCRYQYCLAAGMKTNRATSERHTPEEGVPKQECLEVAVPSPTARAPITFKYTLAMIIGHLETMDLCRRHTFNNQILVGDLSLDDVISTDFNRLKLVSKPSEFRGNFYDWATMDQISAINFMKRFAFVEAFDEQQRNHFVKRSYVKYIMLITGWRNMTTAKDAVEYPGDVDVFPDEVKSTTTVPQKTLNRIRCQLVAKMRELEVTKEEFLLLAGMIICDPNNMNLTDANRSMLTDHRALFGSSLMQYCQLKCGGVSGANRYTNLLGLHDVIAQNFRDFGNVWVQYLVSYQPTNIRQMFSDFLSLTMG